MTKYGEQIARIDERTAATLKHLEALNDSQEKQWKAINKNMGDIRELKTRVSLFAVIQASVSAALGAILAWMGVRK